MNEDDKSPPAVPRPATLRPPAKAFPSFSLAGKEESPTASGPPAAPKEDAASPPPAEPVTEATVADWAKAKKTPAWLVRAALVKTNWRAPDRMLTEAEFDAGVALTQGIQLGGIRPAKAEKEADR